MPNHNNDSYIPRLYGRRQDKALKPRQARLMETLLPRLSVPVEQDTPIDLTQLFPGKQEFWLEVGFGGGEHLAWQAAQNPEIGMIGAEPFINGVAKLLSQIEDENLKNIHIHHGDVRPLLETLPDQCLNKLFVLHPDPWPKSRHHKRRMISPWFFKQAARLVKPSGILRVASDIPGYISWTLMHAQNQPWFSWKGEKMSDWTKARPDWPQTRYEAKAIREGRTPTYLEFDRTKLAYTANDDQMANL